MKMAPINSFPGSVALWTCNGVLVAITVLLVVLRRYRHQRINLSDTWLLFALLFNGLRMAADYYTNTYGTPLNFSLLHEKEMDAGSLQYPDLTAQDRRNLVLTGQLSIAGRVTLAVVLWCYKLAVADMLHSLLKERWYRRAILVPVYTLLAGSFIGSVVSVFLECSTVSENWRVFPSPSQCNGGLLWIVTHEILNTGTDCGLFLFFFIFILVLRRGGRGLWMIALASILITIKIFRIVQGFFISDVVQNNIIWYNIEVVFSALIATLPVIFKLVWSPDGDNEHNRREGPKDDEARLYRQPTVPVLEPMMNGQPETEGWELNDLSTPTEASCSHQAPPKDPPHLVLQHMTGLDGRPESWYRQPTSSERASRAAAGYSGWWQLDDNGVFQIADTVDSSGDEVEESDEFDEDFEVSTGVAVRVATEINLNEESRRISSEVRPQIVTVRTRRFSTGLDE